MNKTENQKHAFCIMAHDDTECLQVLLRLLDDENNTLFLHIDRKSDKINEELLKTNLSRLIIIPANARINVNWGGLSQVKAELLLFKKALNDGDFSYLHLISGSDLPLQSNKAIHGFFKDLPEGTNIVTFSHGKAIEENVDFKTRYYHPFVEYQKFRKDGNLYHFLQDMGAKSLRKIMVEIQKRTGYRRNYRDMKIKKGSNWVSITQDFARYLVENEKKILKMFRGVICPDEIFLHTMLYNSKFRDTIWDYSNEKGFKTRYIDWERGTPYVWQQEDYEELKSSGSLFARKFSSHKDKEIINLILRDGEKHHNGRR